MKKSELRDGDIVKLRRPMSPQLGIIVGVEIEYLDRSGGHSSLNNYNEDLSHKNFDRFDIIAVYPKRKTVFDIKIPFKQGDLVLFKWENGATYCHFVDINYETEEVVLYDTKSKDGEMYDTAKDNATVMFKNLGRFTEIRIIDID